MPHRIHVGSSFRLIACAAALVFTRPLAAQEPRVIINAGDKIALSAMTVPISDDAIRSMIQLHLPEELQQSDPRHIVLVVDANNEYLSSRAGKATVITGEGTGSTFVIGDSTGASAGAVVIRRGAMTGSSDTAAAGTVTVLRTKIEGGDMASGVFGSGYSMAEVSSIGIRRFAAGQLGTGVLVVSVVKLKP
jgi:hypothetical protein